MTKLTTLIHTSPETLRLTSEEKFVLVATRQIIKESKTNCSGTAQVMNATGYSRSFIEKTSQKIWHDCFYLTKYTDRTID